ncbi:MAG: histidine ammonia-lyase [Microbacterium sp.]|nr:histidine ammonia-lyase [Microbacterium sp.]
MPNDLAAYFLSLTNERSVRALAARSELDQSTTTRQLAGTSELKVGTVVAICRAYGLDFADVFVAVGFITEEEARRFNLGFRLSEATDAELAQEIVRRLGQGEASAAITEPISDEVVAEVVAEREASADPDSIPYIGKIKREDMPERRAADKKPRVGDDPAE